MIAPLLWLVPKEKPSTIHRIMPSFSTPHAPLSRPNTGPRSDPRHNPELGISGLWPIHLTGVTCVGGGSACWRALSEVHGGAPGLVPDRCRLPRLSGVASLACGFLMSGLWPGRWLAPG